MPVVNGEPVTVLRATGRPRLGEQPQREAHHVITGCVVAPAESAEISQYSSATVTAWELFLPSGSDLKSTDQVECRGLVWSVVGEPSDWRSPFSHWRPGMRVTITRTRG